MVNFAVALSFSAVFFVVAQRSTSPLAGRWLGAGFAVASLSALCELLVAYAGPPRLWALGAFASVLCGLVMMTVGIGEMYRRRVDARGIAVFLPAALFMAYVIYDLPRGTPLHAFLYQGPFAFAVLAGAQIVISAPNGPGSTDFLVFCCCSPACIFWQRRGWLSPLVRARPPRTMSTRTMHSSRKA
ncbi:hypothetical protein V6L77_22490 [Pannonibacter sp. Pt2-lr]